MNRRSFLGPLACLPWTFAAWGQARPIKIIVPFAPGGSTDVIAREVADAMSKTLGVPIIIDNRAGGGGSIGTAELARAAADGMTLGMATQSTHAVNPVVYKKLTYDPLKDFAVIGEIAQAPAILLVKEALPVKDLPGFIAYARQHPGRLSYSSPGSGTLGHLSGEQFKHATGLHMMHIPYRGASPALTDLVAGVVDATFTSVASGLSFVQSGRVRALAVSWPKRLDVLQSVPTFAEGGVPSLNEPTWFGLVAPAGVPRETLRSLQLALANAVRQTGLQQKFLGQGLFASTRSVEQFQETIRHDMERARQISRVANISVE